MLRCIPIQANVSVYLTYFNPSGLSNLVLTNCLYGLRKIQTFQHCPLSENVKKLKARTCFSQCDSGSKIQRGSFVCLVNLKWVRNKWAAQKTSNSSGQRKSIPPWSVPRILLSDIVGQFVYVFGLHNDFGMQSMNKAVFYPMQAWHQFTEPEWRKA